MSLSATPTLSEILDEVDETLPHTFPSTKTNWIGVGPPLVFPTSFANKSRIKLLDTQLVVSPGNNVTFSGMDCGDAIDGRMLYTVIGILGTTGGSHAINGTPQINGSSSTTGDGAWGTHTNGKSQIAVVNTLQDNTTLGLNGSAYVPTNSTIDYAFCALYAAYDTTQLSPHYRHDGQTGTTQVTSISNNMNVPARGQIMAAALARRMDVADTATVTGVEKRDQFFFGASGSEGALIVAYDTLQALNASQNINFSWPTATNASLVIHTRAN